MGAKRRKAAKKKKDKYPNSITTSATAAISNGNGDLKTQESDGSTISSPASQDNNQSNNPFSQGEKDASREQLNVPENEYKKNSQDDNKENQKIVTNDEGSNENIESLKTIEKFDIGDVAVKHRNGAQVSNYATKQNDEPRGVWKNSGGTKPFFDSVEPHRSVPDNKTIAQFEGTSVQRIEIAETNKPMMKDMKDSPSVVDSKIKENQDTVISLPDESSKEPPSAVDTALTETVDKIVPPTNVPFSEISNGVKPVKDLDVSNDSENQPLLAVASRPVQKTSWKGCCGLFEVLSVSDR